MHLMQQTTVTNLRHSSSQTVATRLVTGKVPAIVLQLWHMVAAEKCLLNIEANGVSTTVPQCRGAQPSASREAYLMPAAFAAVTPIWLSSITTHLPTAQ